MKYKKLLNSVVNSVSVFSTIFSDFLTINLVLEWMLSYFEAVIAKNRVGTLLKKFVRYRKKSLT